MSNLTWKESAGRSYGKDGYLFGDMMRTLFNKLTVARAQFSEDRPVTEGRLQPPPGLFSSFDALKSLSGVTESPHDTGAPSTLENRVWLSLFNACHACGAHALCTGVLERDEVKDCEAFLFLGLPALAALECCLRSVGKQGLVLADGTVLGRGQVDASTEAGRLLDQMLGLIAMLEAATAGSAPELDAASLDVLRSKAVHASGEHAACADPAADRLANQVRSTDFYTAYPRRPQS